MTTAELVTWERIPIAAVGNHQTSVGDGGMTLKDLQDAVAAERDPEIKTARTILGHTVRKEGDKLRFLDRAVVGRTKNLVLDGDTLYADITVPPKIDAVAEVAFPSRSIEAIRNVTTASGSYGMVLTGLALLSDELPAVETLADLEDLWARNDSAAPHAAGDAAPLVAASRLVICALPPQGPKPAAPAVDNTDPSKEAPMGNPQDTPTPEPTNAPAPNTPAGDAPQPAAPAAQAPTTEPAQATPSASAPEPTAEAPQVAIPDGFKLVEDEQWDDVQAKLAKLDQLVEKTETADAKQFADQLVAAGKIAPKSKDKIVAQYRDNPAGTAAVFEHVAATIPVGQLATFSRHPDTAAVTDDELPPSLISFTAAEQARVDRTTPKGA